MTQSNLFSEPADRLVFVGGGNMAGALLGGLLKAGRSPDSLVVIEPAAAQADLLHQRYGVRIEPNGSAAFDGVAMVVWAVKPQVFATAAQTIGARAARALHVSVMAGIRSDAIAAATSSERVVRAMPNTPALVGQGIAGLYARPAVTAAERTAVEALLSPTGQTMWVSQEAELDAVTALSGSGPAYVFYFIEALIDAALEMGMTPDQGRQLALATFQGATALAHHATEPIATLRERVTSQGGTTHAALTVMTSLEVKEAIVKAVRAAQQRARELGDEFGR